MPAQLVSPRLSVPTRSFLTTIGLPYGSHWAEFFHDDRLSGPVVQQGREYLPIGADDRGPLVIEPESDSMFHLLPEPYYVNADVSLFVYFHGLFVREIQRLDSVTEMEHDEFADLVDDSIMGIDRRMRDLDPSACTTGSWWDCLLTEMVEQGHM
ncbi:hypothetical protein ABH933_002481 [Nocardia sp. GP40]|uniref:SUKH-4 family immunity protein n=1 Tax=Nocardia sp. GP40 TaxID=3156268 RepID=UPI003D1F4A2D